MKHTFTNEQIKEVMRRDRISRKSAIRKLNKAATTAKAKKEPKAKVAKMQTDVGKARSAGIQLFALAGWSSEQGRLHQGLRRNRTPSDVGSTGRVGR